MFYNFVQLDVFFSWHEFFSPNLHSKLLLISLLIVSFSFSVLVGGSANKSTKEAGCVVAKRLQHAHMPPELLVHVDVPIEVLKSFYLLPSLMHRLESLMLASQLRKEINFPSVIASPLVCF